MTTLEKISGAAIGSNVIIMNKQYSLSQYIYTHKRRFTTTKQAATKLQINPH